MKRTLFLAAVVLAALLMFALVSCQNNDPVVTTQQNGTTTTAPATTTAAPEQDAFDLGGFSIVRYMKSTKGEITATKNLKEYLESYMGVSLKISTDEVRKGETLDNSRAEILV